MLVTGVAYFCDEDTFILVMKGEGERVSVCVLAFRVKLIVEF